MADKKWILPPPGGSSWAPPPKLRLLCIPHAGSGAHVYHPWVKALPAEVEVLPIELPGRNTRMRDPRPSSMQALVSDMLAALEPLFKANKKKPRAAESGTNSDGVQPPTAPFAFFGHSLGAWIAFAATQELQARRHGGARDTLLPVALFVSGVRAPQLAGVAHDPDGVEMHTIETPVEFWAAMERRYGKNPELVDPGVRKFMLPMLQADFRVSETYQPAFGAGDLPLQCPLFVFGGAQDPRYSPAQLDAWSAWVPPSPQPLCQIKLFPGGHHFLFKAAESRDQFVSTLSALLNQILTAGFQVFTNEQAAAAEQQLSLGLGTAEQSEAAETCELPGSQSAVEGGRADSVHSMRSVHSMHSMHSMHSRDSRDSRDSGCVACGCPSPPSVGPSDADATVASGSSYAHTAAAGGRGRLAMGRGGDGSGAALLGSPKRRNWLLCWC